MKSRFLIFLIPVISMYANAQTAITDSLRHAVYAANTSQQKLTAILDYCDQYQSLNRDTAYNYALLAVNMTKETNDKRSQARASLAFARSYYLWGWVDSAGAVCDSALKKYNAADAIVRDVYFNLVRQKALCYGGVQQYPEALDILYKLLRESEHYKDSVTIAATCNTIGSVNINMGKPAEALKWVFRTLDYDTKATNFFSIKAATFTNAAFAYMQDGDNDSAMLYIKKALPLCRQSQNLNTLATALRIRSGLYVNTKNYPDAEKDLREMIAIRRMLGSNSNITDDNLQIANFYASTGQLDKAIALCKENIHDGDMYTTRDSVAYTNHLNLKLEYYEALAGFYKQAGMQSAYTATLEEIVAAKDSFYEANSARAIAEIQTKYQTEQKEKTILQQKYDLTKKNFIIYGSLGLVLFSAIILLLVFREYRRKQQIKMQLAMERESRTKQVAVKEAEEKERKRIAADLHDNLGVQANAILYNTELLKDDLAANGSLVEGLHDTAKQMLLNLRETLWAMKTNDIGAAELWLRIINFSKQMGRHYPHIHFATKGGAPHQMQLPSAKALNTVMIIQEAVQNSVKHSGSKEIIIASNVVHHTWHITIHDTGKGFEFVNAFAQNDSHGLKNMRQRAGAGGLTLEIDSHKNGGTVVGLQVETNK